MRPNYLFPSNVTRKRHFFFLPPIAGTWVRARGIRVGARGGGDEAIVEEGRSHMQDGFLCVYGREGK